MEWISVKDRLPEDDRYVLACYRGFDNEYYFSVVSYFEGSKQKKWFMLDATSDINELNDIITHWMELPKAPHDS